MDPAHKPRAARLTSLYTHTSSQARDIYAVGWEDCRTCYCLDDKASVPPENWLSGNVSFAVCTSICCKASALRPSPLHKLICSYKKVCCASDTGATLLYLSLQLRELCSRVNGFLAAPSLVELRLPLLVGLRGRPCGLEEYLCAHRADQHIRIPQGHLFLQWKTFSLQLQSGQDIRHF